MQISTLAKQFLTISLLTSKKYLTNYRYWKVNTNKIRSDDVHTDSEVKAAYALSGGSAGSRTIATIATSGGYDLSRCQ